MQDIAVQMLASKLSGHDYSGTDIASVVITGMSVVFIGLILLVLFVSIYGTAFKRKNEKIQSHHKHSQRFILAQNLSSRKSNLILSLFISRKNALSRKHRTRVFLSYTLKTRS